MTVETEVTRVIVEGNGATTVFAYSFPITGSSSTDQTNAELILTDSAGVSTTLTNSLWSITGVVTTGPIDGTASGTFTYSPAISTGSFLTLARIVPFEQTASLGSQGAYSPTVVENALDNLALQTEQLNTRLLQTVRAPITDDALSELPSAVDRASSFLFFDSAGDVTTASTTAGMPTAIYVGTNSTNANLTNTLLTTGSGVSSATTVAGVTTVTITGGSATPGGSSGQIQFNNAGSLGGFTMGTDATITTAGALTIASGVVTNAKLATMATQTIKGRTTAGTGAPEDLTATQATAVLNAMVGDSGAGVTKGLVPSASTGNATTAFLRKDGTWVAPSGTALTVKDGSTTVSSVTTVSFTSGATVTDGTGGLANVAVSGGGGGGGYTWIATFTANNTSANLDCTGFISGTYNVYKFVLTGFTLATNAADLQMRIGTGGGPTYDSGSNYEWNSNIRDGTNAATGNSGAGTTTECKILVGISAGQVYSNAEAEFTWHNFNSTSLRKCYYGLCNYVTSAPAMGGGIISGDWITTSTAVTALRVSASSGNLVTGAIYVYGLQKS